MRARVLTAIIGLPLIFIMIWLGGWFVFVTTYFLSIVALKEYVNAVNHNNRNNVNFILLVILTTIILLLMKFDFYSIPFSLVLCLITLFIYEIFNSKPSFNRVLLSLFFLLYIPLMFGFLVMFDNTIDGRFTIWMVFLSAFATDTFAYFGGIYFKGPKLTPISPNKTISGSISGIVASAIVIAIYGFLVQGYFDVHFSIIGYLLMGAIASIIGQIGDISASLIKRTYDIKDFGKILPGHGGILDRFDSIIFTVPIIYIFTYYFLG